MTTKEVCPSVGQRIPQEGGTVNEEMSRCKRDLRGEYEEDHEWHEWADHTNVEEGFVQFVRFVGFVTKVSRC